MKGYKIWDPKDKKIILSRDVTFDLASIVKPMNSQQMESEKIKRISQQMESDASPPSPNSSVSFEITREVPRDGDHVAYEDANDDEDQEYVMGEVQDSTAVGKTRRNSCKPSWLTTNMIVTYVLLVIEDTISSTYRKTEISLKSKM